MASWYVAASKYCGSEIRARKQASMTSFNTRLTGNNHKRRWNETSTWSLAAGFCCWKDEKTTILTSLPLSTYWFIFMLQIILNFLVSFLNLIGHRSTSMEEKKTPTSVNIANSPINTLNIIAHAASGKFSLFCRLICLTL